MSVNEQELEKQIQAKGLNAPRLTPDSIDSVIVGEDSHVFPGTNVTVCLLKLKNGFSAVGSSACVSKENFDAAIGLDIARNDAKQKVWGLEGYLLKQRLYALET